MICTTSVDVCCLLLVLKRPHGPQVRRFDSRLGIERGTKEIRVTTLMRLVDGLGAPRHELLGGLSLPVSYAPGTTNCSAPPTHGRLIAASPWGWG
jgi:hypothetical protein